MPFFEGDHRNKALTGLGLRQTTHIASCLQACISAETGQIPIFRRLHGARMRFPFSNVRPLKHRPTGIDAFLLANLPRPTFKTLVRILRHASRPASYARSQSAENPRQFRKSSFPPRPVRAYPACRRFFFRPSANQQVFLHMPTQNPPKHPAPRRPSQKLSRFASGACSMPFANRIPTETRLGQDFRHKAPPYVPAGPGKRQNAGMRVASAGPANRHSREEKSSNPNVRRYLPSP